MKTKATNKMASIITLLSFIILSCIYKQTFAEISITKLDDPSTDNTLKAAFILFRHGDRNPIMSYRNDPHQNYSWPGGYSALTTKGALQAYNLGKLLRKNYQNLLPENGYYSKDVLSVTSSNIDRTIMTAQSVLAGLLPPPKHYNLLPIQWQPAPVFTISLKDDNKLGLSRPCDKYTRELMQTVKNPPKDFEQMIENLLPNETLYEYLSRNTGSNITNFVSLIYLYDTLKIQQNNGLELPEWVNLVSPEIMKPIIERCYGMLTETFEMRRTKTGPLLTEILQIMDIKRKTKYQFPQQKLFLYSGHDITLLPMIKALSIEEQTTKMPEYTSALSFEIHETVEVHNDLEVKLFFYENSDIEEPRLVNIPNCIHPCSLKTFIKTLMSYVVFDYDKICEIQEFEGRIFGRKGYFYLPYLL